MKTHMARQAELRRNAGLPTSCSLVPEGAPMTEVKDLVRALQDRRLRFFRSDGINGRIVRIDSSHEAGTACAVCLALTAPAHGDIRVRLTA